MSQTATVTMDRLDDLPNQPIQYTQQEAATMQQYFDPAQPAVKGKFQKIEWKIIAASAALFLLLANPWIDKIFCKIPHCEDNQFILLGIKVLLFMLLMVVIYMFMK